MGMASFFAGAGAIVREVFHDVDLSWLILLLVAFLFVCRFLKTIEIVFGPVNGTDRDKGKNATPAKRSDS